MITTSTRVATPVQSNIRACLQCSSSYDWRRSTSSSLKMTYCSALCERLSLGFTIESLLEIHRRQTPAEANLPGH